MPFVRNRGEVISTPATSTTTPEVIDTPEDQLAPRRLLGLWLVVVVFAVVMLIRSWWVGIGLRDPHGSIFLVRTALTLALFAALVAVDVVARTARGARDLAGLGRTFRSRWTRRRILLATSGILAFQTVYFSYHNLKSWDVLRAPQDSMLERWDRALFLGHSPAVVLHDLLGQHVAAYVLMVFYESFTTVVTLAFVAAMVFPRRIRESYVYLAGFSWVWILGVASYYLIPSLGPFHEAPQDFAGLPHTMIQDTQARYLAQRDQLLAHPHAHDAFAQISAFASLHVAVTGFVLLMARYYGLRRISRVLAVWVAGTVVATVYLGWHFAVDDVAGALIALSGVRLGRLMFEDRRPAG